jgi:poly-beta-hydroxyalkanoate depolymerase
MEFTNLRQFEFRTKGSLYVNPEGQLIEPLSGHEVSGVDEIAEVANLDEIFIEDWEDEDFSLLSS